jgi:Spy/CpxP family protein refolding chaperone
VLKAMYARKLLSATAALTLAAVALLAWVSYAPLAAAPQRPPEPQPKQEKPAADKGDAEPVDVTLLQERRVVRELKCTDEQWDRIDDALEAAMDKFQKMALDPANFQQPEDFEKAMKDILAGAAKEVTQKILKPAQVKRLRQIELQALGAHAFSRPHVQAALKLTDKQREQVKDEMDKAQQAIQDLIQNGLNNPVNPGALWDPKTLQAQYDIAAQNVRKLLTDEQRKLWTELAGEPLRFNPRRNPMLGDFPLMAPGALPFGGGAGGIVPPAGGIVPDPVPAVPPEKK